MQETSKEKCNIMSWIAIGVGLLMVTVIPFFGAGVAGKGVGWLDRSR